MTKKPENIDTYKDGRGAPITESSAHYMNEHGDTFTGEQIAAVEHELDNIWAYEHRDHSVAEAFRIAARLILQARAERDEWKLKFHLGIDDVLAARKERDAAQERMREFAAQKAHFMAERDAALVRVRELEATGYKAALDRANARCSDAAAIIAALEAENAELRKSFRLACIAISNPDRIAENERLRAALDQPGLEDLGTLDLLAMLRAALARVREVEDCHERTKELCDVHCERIAALEAEIAAMSQELAIWNRQADLPGGASQRIAENERLRAAWGKVETMFNWAQFRATDPAMHIRTYLRAALKGEGDE